jgi:nitrite reductase/ring-hydroxylating ferredoxin subunit
MNSERSDQLRWYHLGEAEELRRKKASEFVVADKIVAVFFENENWYAIDSVCAHQGGPLVRGIVADGCVTCPWHGWRYNLANGCNTVTGKQMLHVYPVRLIDGSVEIGIAPDNQ